MTTDTLTLTAFLLARIEEDEARAASDIDHFCDPDDNADKWITMYAKRLAAECAAKRVALDWYENDDAAVMLPTIVALASVYADHPDFNPDWA